jgi:dTDP-4-amino-4,6-dideoxygalactose transaminase
MYHQKNHLPVTDEVGREIVSIPIHPNLSETDVNKIISSINNYA